MSYSILGVSLEKRKFLLLNQCTDDEIEVSFKKAVLMLSEGVEIYGCKYGPKGLRIAYHGNSEYDIEIEVWKPVTIVHSIELNGTYRYYVSNLGRMYRRGYISNGKRVVGGFVSVENPYMMATIRDSYGVKHGIKLARIVAHEFIPNWLNFEYVRHKNYNLLDNGAYNLEWVEHQLACREDYVVPRKIIQFDLLWNVVAEYNSLEEVMLIVHGLKKQFVLSCCNRVPSHGSHAGFIWRFADDVEPESERKPLIVEKHLKTIRRYTRFREFIAEYPNLTEAGRDVCKTSHVIGRHCRNHRVCADSIWRFEDDDELASIPTNVIAIEQFRRWNNAESPWGRRR